MNVFATSICPKESAMWLDDKRANKMILETAQLLSTAIQIGMPDHGLNLYKQTHKNHPSAVWVKEDMANFTWACRHMYWLGTRYPHHKSLDIHNQIVPWMEGKWRMLPTTPFANCAARKDMGLDFRSYSPDVTECYRAYLCARWELDKRPPTWNTGIEPEWRK